MHIFDLMAGMFLLLNSNNKQIMRLLVLALFAFMATAANSCRFFNSNKDKARILAEEKARQDSLRVADSIRKAFDLSAHDTARADSLKMEQERLASENRFSIIIGSFINSEYAHKMLSDYEKKGYSPMIIKPAGSKFELVAIQGYARFRSALTSLKNIRDSAHSEAWIYQLKQDERFILK